MKFLKSIILVIALGFTFQACDVLEDPQPSTAIDNIGALDDPDVVLALRTSMYGQLHAFGYSTNYFLGAESIADNMTLRPGRSRFGALNRGSLRAGVSLRANTYSINHRANLLISVEPGVLDPTVEDYVKAEAFFFRAFAAHNNARVLGYEPGMTPATGQGAGFDLADVIRTEPVENISEVDERPRNTVAEVYTQIKADLDSAIVRFQGTGRSNRNFITSAAAEALYARVNLYERDYAGALARATNARNNTSATLAAPAQVFNMFDETAGLNPEGIFVALVDPDQESQGVNSSLAAYTAKQWVAQIPTANVLALYDAADERNAWFSACDNEPAGVRDTDSQNNLGNCAGVNGGFELNKWDGEKGQFADDLPFLRVSEMVLIQAEAALGDPNTAGAAEITNSLAFLNELRTNRGLAALTPVDVGNDGPTLLNEILDERRREFVGEGQRFFDLKRLGRDILKGPQGSTVPYTDLRILDDISTADLEANSLLVNNPDY